MTELLASLVYAAVGLTAGSIMLYGGQRGSPWSPAVAMAWGGLSAVLATGLLMWVCVTVFALTAAWGWRQFWIKRGTAGA